MKNKLLNIAIACCIIVGFSSCATFTKARYNSDFKSGLNLVTTTVRSEGLKVTINGKESVAKMIYNGAEKHSPFYVYRVHVPGCPKHLSVAVNTPSGNREYKVERQKARGWFWIGGLWVIVDYFTKGVYFYHDVNIDA